MAYEYDLTLPPAVEQRIFDLETPLTAGTFAAAVVMGECSISRPEDYATVGSLYGYTPKERFVPPQSVAVPRSYVDHVMKAWNKRTDLDVPRMMAAGQEASHGETYMLASDERETLKMRVDNLMYNSIVIKALKDRLGEQGANPVAVHASMMVRLLVEFNRFAEIPRRLAGQRYASAVGAVVDQADQQDLRPQDSPKELLRGESGSLLEKVEAVEWEMPLPDFITMPTYPRNVATMAMLKRVCGVLRNTVKVYPELLARPPEELPDYFFNPTLLTHSTAELDAALKEHPGSQREVLEAFYKGELSAAQVPEPIRALPPAVIPKEPKPAVNRSITPEAMNVTRELALARHTRTLEALERSLPEPTMKALNDALRAEAGCVLMAKGEILDKPELSAMLGRTIHGLARMRFDQVHPPSEESLLYPQVEHNTLQVVERIIGSFAGRLREARIIVSLETAPLEAFNQQNKMQATHCHGATVLLGKRNPGSKTLDYAGRQYLIYLTEPADNGVVRVLVRSSDKVIGPRKIKELVQTYNL